MLKLCSYLIKIKSLKKNEVEIIRVTYVRVEGIIEAGGKNNQGDRQQNDKKQRNFSDKTTIKCFRCGKIGHIVTNCRIPWRKLMKEEKKCLKRKII